MHTKCICQKELYPEPQNPTFGYRALQDPHQVAKNSTTTNFSPAFESASRNSCVEWISRKLGSSPFCHHFTPSAEASRPACIWKPENPAFRWPPTKGFGSYVY